MKEAITAFNRATQQSTEKELLKLCRTAINKFGKDYKYPWLVKEDANTNENKS